MPSFSLRKPAGFALSAAAAFYAHFTPGSDMAAAALDRLTFAFRLDGTFAPVVVALQEQRDALLVEVEGDADLNAVAKQLKRILGLEATPPLGSRWAKPIWSWATCSASFRASSAPPKRRPMTPRPGP